MRLILLDRDGVINEDRDDYVKNPGELVLVPGSAAAIARLNRAGVKVAVCTNQACIGRGIVAPEMLDRIHDALRDRLAVAGAHLDLLLFAPDPPWAAGDRRKPGPGMLREAIGHFRADPGATPFVGDTVTDLQAAKAAGCPRILVRSGKGAATQSKGLPGDLLPVAVADDLAQAVDRFLGTGGP